LPKISPASSVSLDDEFHIITTLEKTPTLSQRDLASVLGFSVGKVNYCLKALIDKGLIKAGRFAQNPKKLEYAYLLTPQGIASKAALTAHFLERKKAQYEALRAEIENLQAQSALADELPCGKKIEQE
jgi:EPS-associated MarR family transcriptional regulator